MTTSEDSRQVHRLLKVIHYPIFGGPHNQALRLAGPLGRRSWETLVLVPREPGNAAERLRAGGIAVEQMPLNRLRSTRDPRVHWSFACQFAGDVRRIRRLLRRERVDLVMIGGLVNPHAAVAAYLEGIPVVWRITDSRTPALLRRALMPAVRRLADAVMFNGRSLIDLHGGTTLRRLPVFVYYPSVDSQRFAVSAERRTQMRQRLGIPLESPVVGMVANLNPQKGIEYFVRAAGLIVRAHPDCTFLVIGATYGTHEAYTSAIQQEVRNSGIPASRFIFAGAQSDLEYWYPAMDVKLITSVPRSEGTTTTAMEAMACGIPVVATDVGAVREVVEDGVTGFVVPPLNPQAIAGATLRLLDDAALRARMGEAARRRAVERYDVEVCADTHIRAFEAAIAHHRLRRAGDFEADTRVPATTCSEPELRTLLVCPACRAPLDWTDDQARCTRCDGCYPIVDGIPLLLADRATAEHDELDHLHGDGHAGHAGDGHKERQAAHFDRADAAEFEVTRPHGTPALYRHLLAEKFRRSVQGIEALVPGATALTVCGGSGMDAEFLARAGARVIASDISLGAAQRTSERARRYGLAITPIVADVERLPLRDRSVDLVYVHDGLHHLERPEAGLSEMGRVAARAVSVTEPARARATQIAVRLRWALEQEEAGNRVARLTASEVSATLRGAGLTPVGQQRYAMYYRHVPGRATALLSTPAVFKFVRPAWRLANAVAGRWGNKLTVQAVRKEA